MQIDMHFHATHAIALLAGLPAEEALIVATAAQYVDDADFHNSDKNSEGEMMFAICTGHHPLGSYDMFGHVRSATISHVLSEAHRQVWVPFHFLPGNEGETLEEKLLCVKNSPIANQLFKHYIARSDETRKKKPYYWHLLGIASHVYLDTFSHYGFSGIASDMNKVQGDSITTHIDDPKIRRYVEGKAKKFEENTKMN